MSVKEIIYKRSSCRKYKNEQIKDEELEMIIEAGRHAPSGGNSQTTHMLVIQNKDVLTHIMKLVTDAFKIMEITEGTYKSIVSSITQAKKGDYLFYYDAPTLIVVANKKGYGNAIADSSCALENMMLVSTELNIGSCWINQLHWLNENKEVRDYLESIGLGSDEDICGGLALGYPDQKMVVKKITGNKVTYIK